MSFVQIFPLVCALAVFPAACGYAQPLTRLPGVRVAYVQSLSSGRLTLGQLEEMALTSHPTLMRDRARVGALEGKWLQAGLRPNPNIGYSADDVGLGGAAGMHGMFFGQRFVTGGKLELNQAVVAQEIEAARAQFETNRRRIITDVGRAFYRVLIADRRQRTAIELQTISNAAVETSRRLLAAQEASRVALLQTELSAQQTRIVVRQAKNELESAWRQLRAVVGTDVPIQPLEGSPETLPAELDWANTVDRLVAESPLFHVAQAELERSHWDLQRAHAQVVPDVNVQVSTLYDDGASDMVTAFQFGIELPIVNRNQGGIQRAYRQVAVAEQNIRRLETRLRGDLADVYRQYADARYQVEQYRRDILPTAKETFDLVTNGYQQGEVGYLDLLNAQRVYFQTNLAWLRALRELWDATVRIEGLLLEDGASQP